MADPATPTDGAPRVGDDIARREKHDAHDVAAHATSVDAHDDAHDDAQHVAPLAHAPFLQALGFTLLLVVVFGALRALVQRALRRGRARLVDDNAAHRLYAVGQLFGLLWLAASIVRFGAHGEDVIDDLTRVFVLGLVGLGCAEAAGHLGVRLLLGARLPQEIDDGNLAAALAGAAHHIAVAVLAAAVARGDDVGSVALATGFFALAVIVHQLCVALFRALTTYDDAEQIAGENTAAAISYAGASLGTALIVARALDGDFTGWLSSIGGFFGVASLALMLLPLRQLVVGGLLLRARPRWRGGRLDDAIGLEHDVTLAALDAAVAIGAALALTQLV